MGLGSLLLQFPRYEHLMATSASFIVNWRQACPVPLSSNRLNVRLFLAVCSSCQLAALVREPYMWTAWPSRTPRATQLSGLAAEAMRIINACSFLCSKFRRLQSVLRQPESL